MAENSTALEHLLESAEAELDVCAFSHVSYDHRVDNPANWNWCLVPGK
jgi:hypothetical protein